MTRRVFRSMLPFAVAALCALAAACPGKATTEDKDGATKDARDDARVIVLGDLGDDRRDARSDGDEPADQGGDVVCVSCSQGETGCCPEGEAVCECQQVGSGCNAWVVTQDCGSGSCVASACCPAGKECGDTCCTGDDVCSGGQCKSSPSCVDECTQDGCEGLTPYACVKQGDGCYDKVTEPACNGTFERCVGGSGCECRNCCGAGATCVGSTLVTPDCPTCCSGSCCVHECASNGETGCDGGTRPWSCSVDAAGCRKKVYATPCPTYQRCDLGGSLGICRCVNCCDSSEYCDYTASPLSYPTCATCCHPSGTCRTKVPELVSFALPSKPTGAAIPINPVFEWADTCRFVCSPVGGGSSRTTTCGGSFAPACAADAYDCTLQATNSDSGRSFSRPYHIGCNDGEGTKECLCFVLDNEALTNDCTTKNGPRPFADSSWYSSEGSGCNSVVHLNSPDYPPAANYYCSGYWWVDVLNWRSYCENPPWVAEGDPYCDPLAVCGT